MFMFAIKYCVQSFFPFSPLGDAKLLEKAIAYYYWTLRYTKTKPTGKAYVLPSIIHFKEESER